MAKQFEDKKKGDKADSGNPKEDAIEVMATVIEPLPNAMFRVELETSTRFWRMSQAKCVRTSFAYFLATGSR